jgi:prevent-host-death family protein
MLVVVVLIMPTIRPITDLRNNSNEISEFCRTSREPVFITKNGVGDMVVLSVEMYERLQAQLELYARLAEAEAEIAMGAVGVDFSGFAKKLRASIHGRI